MTELVIMRGLPGSGKTTLARAWVAEDRANRARVNRDDLRQMLDEGVHIPFATEPRVLLARNATIVALLRAGCSVVVDETNLAPGAVAELTEIARAEQARVSVTDLTDVPLGTCLERNALRSGIARVPEDVIRDMHAKLSLGGTEPTGWNKNVQTGEWREPAGRDTSATTT